MATNPDHIFAKIISGDGLSRAQIREVASWSNSSNEDELVAWCYWNLKTRKHILLLRRTITLLLSSKSIKSQTNILVVLQGATRPVFQSASLQKALLKVAKSTNVAVRGNATWILSFLASIGVKKAVRMLVVRTKDTDLRVRKNAKIFASRLRLNV